MKGLSFVTGAMILIMSGRYPKYRINVFSNFMPTLSKNSNSKIQQIEKTITIYIAKMRDLLTDSLEFYKKSESCLKQVFLSIVYFAVDKKSFLLSGIV